ncbi:MAG: NADH-quinone oxidoreductase subunit J [Anaerolineales bacterium]|nr:MAG: NADH-quinone oxidoreductase subunit J [Anaerolineales bacterium]
MDLVLFLGLALIAVVAAIAMIVSRSAIYSALFLVLNFLTVATLYLLLNAAFIAVVQITVYAGAIMVLFLFVIMLLGPERESIDGGIRWQVPLATVMGLALAGELAYVLLRNDIVQGPLADLSAEFGSPASIGRVLFSEYLVPFEVTSILLLVAMIGAIVITRKQRRERK